MSSSVRVPPSARSSSSSNWDRANDASLGGRLHLDQLPGAIDDHVHVRLGARVLEVPEIQPALTVDDADAHRGHRVQDRGPLQASVGEQAAHRELERHVPAADARAARAPIGGQDVAVDPERPLPERLQCRRSPAASVR